MSSYRIEGIIIKRHDLGEADKIITLYTKEQGKLSLKAKGLRRPSSRRSGTLELFHQVRALVVPGRGNLDVVTDVELVQSSFSWRKFLGRITVAYQLCEIIDKLTPEQVPAPEVYDFLVSCLGQIPQLSSNWKDVLDGWLVELAKLLGYWPEDKEFVGDIYQFLERITEKPLNSPKLLKKLSK